MTLKTLKDLEFLAHEQQVSDVMRKIKAEAIKWVRNYRKIDEPATAQEFMDFFNITEEDLK